MFLSPFDTAPTEPRKARKPQGPSPRRRGYPQRVCQRFAWNGGRLVAAPSVASLHLPAAENCI